MPHLASLEATYKRTTHNHLFINRLYSHPSSNIYCRGESSASSLCKILSIVMFHVFMPSSHGFSRSSPSALRAILSSIYPSNIWRFELFSVSLHRVSGIGHVTNAPRLHSLHD